MNLQEQLAQIPEFSKLPPTQLQWLAEKGKVETFPDGQKLFSKGDPIREMRILLQGEINFFVEQAGNLRNVGTVEKGEITGKLPFSRMKGATGEGIVSGGAVVYALHEDLFPEMIRNHHELVEVLVHVMTDRVRDTTRQQQLNDKMMALGKLSAGLAHELNNPSAAVVRSAHELKRHLSNIPENFKRVIKIRASDEVVDKVNDLVFSKIASLGKAPLSLMQKTALEDELTTWLEENAIDNAYEMVETFAEFGMQPDDLEEAKSWLRPEDKAPVIGWLYQVFTTEKLVGEIEEAAKRINTLVTSVKGYTHMDQAPEKIPTDIHIGIRNTLTMLNHKLKKNNIKLIESFQADLPKASIYVSEMNQVWTNIIDNAIDAMEGRANSTLEIKTEKSGPFINVSIIDNGPGIPKEIQDKIFDPFFTTKSIGKGTGLGLEVVRQIINQHNGKVYVNSEPGRTEFVVCFPV
ncbi:MAG: GHKL domain-containing protein [Cyclobacteriaceae bacterium]|nr:GHKL domain-containing protein [Cyclobacteriaceae bacterium]